MFDRHFPVRPNLQLLEQQSWDLFAAVREGEPAAMAELQKHQHEHRDLADLKIADAQSVLARSYGLPDWPRLVVACQMTDAIWRGDASAVRELVVKTPQLLAEDARGVRGNWGPPLSYAANLGRNEVIDTLLELGAADVQFAFERACLQGQLQTARKLFARGARPLAGSIIGPCETLSGTGLDFLLELGAPFTDEGGDRLAPVAMILETYSRYPEGKHLCLALAGQQGIILPDTPPLAVHRGRLDLLEKHVRRNPDVLNRTFSHTDIYPPELGCHADPLLALHGTPLAGTTLLHLCVDGDEFDIARWLVDHGADVNAPAVIGADGFGGHTPLFGCAVSQPYRNGLQRDGRFAEFLLEHGADPNIRASLRKQLRFVADESIHEYSNVTALGWGMQFHDRDWVNPAALDAIERAGGKL